MSELDLGTASVGLLLLFSFGMGLRHALEPDHLAAVSTIVSDRKNIWSASLVGGLWGIGHTLALLAAGILVVGLQFQISERVAGFLELAVALMLVLLGIDTLGKVVTGGKVHWHTHSHGGLTHAHPHVHDSSEVKTHKQRSDTHHGLKMNARPLVVGMVHGMAGSGALMLLLLTTIHSTAVKFAYIAIFGIGSVGGMMLMSMLIGLPFHFTLNRFSAAERWLRGGAGLFSLCFGIFWAISNIASLTAGN